MAASGFGVGGTSSAGAATAAALDEQATPLFSSEEAKHFRARWDAIQVSLLTSLGGGVEQADTLVAVAMKRLAAKYNGMQAN